MIYPFLSLKCCFLQYFSSFWKIRPTRVMERPPVQVDTRLRWLFFYPSYFHPSYLVFLFQVCFLHNFYLFFCFFLHRNARLRWLKKLRYLKSPEFYSFFLHFSIWDAICCTFGATRTYCIFWPPRLVKVNSTILVPIEGKLLHWLKGINLQTFKDWATSQEQ